MTALGGPLAGCMTSVTLDSPTDRAVMAALDPTTQSGEESLLIAGLLGRRSVLEAGAYEQVADAVLAANSRAAEAELRAARLRAEAAQHNWLPTIGPSLSLTSLGEVVTSLVLEQTIFDNGRKKAERDFAAADVEVAAVALAQDTNDRVLEALELYLTAQAMIARSNVNQSALERMNHFEYVMSERVRGGVSNRADLQVVQQKVSQMRADLIADQEAANTALAELSAMSAQPIGGITGLSDLSAPAANALPLSVLKAEAESSRSVAEATIARAGFLPGVTASGVARGGETDFGLNVGVPNGLGLGTGAAMQAVEAEREAAAAQVNQAREEAERRLRSLDAQIESLRRQEAEARSLARQAAENYEVFAQQLREGQRTVGDVVGLFETKVRTERAAVVIPFDIAKLELRRAAILGTLVDGDRI